MKTLIRGLALALPFGVSASAEPHRGYVTAPEGDFIQYNCSKVSKATLNCEFIQVALWLKAKPQDLQERLSRVDEMLSEFSKSEFELEFCADDAWVFEAFQAVEEGNIVRLKELETLYPDFDASEALSKWKNRKRREKDDLLQMMETLSSFCDGVTREEVERMIQLEFEKDARTCKLWINEWEDTFERVSDRVWAIQSGGPRGECGVVRLDRFECEESGLLCNYISEKRILNKEGKGIVECSNLDEKIFEYKWNGDEVYLDCSSVTFP